MRLAHVSGTPGAGSNAWVASAKIGSAVMLSARIQVATPTADRLRPSVSRVGGVTGPSRAALLRLSPRSTPTATTASSNRTIPMAETTSNGCATVPDWMNRYTIVDNVTYRSGSPTRAGIPKSARFDTATKVNDATAAGRSNGSVTYVSARSGLAPDIRAASSRSPGMRRKAAATIRYAMG